MNLYFFLQVGAMKFDQARFIDCISNCENEGRNVLTPVLRKNEDTINVIGSHGLVSTFNAKYWSKE